MNFSSLEFVIFAALFFGGWSVIRARAPKTIAWSYLAIASLVFYGWWNPKNVVVLVAITTANYGCGLLITRYRRAGLALAIAAAVAPLIAFKYLRFFAEVLHVNPKIVPHWPVPLGISFISLSAISYAIDVFTEETQPTKNVAQHFSYLALFPVMVAGPIVRAGEMLPQLAKLPPVTPEQRWLALRWITYGLVKKCIVADHIASFTNQIYDETFIPPPYAGVWWFTAVLFAIQLYCDFSGYTDIARGLGRWIGLELPENFNHPFLATGFADFWGRWNISFTNWLRDYIYFPLARWWYPSKLGAVGAVMITFLVSGLWHGAAWTFVVYGLLHGVLIILEHVTKWNIRLAALPGGRYVVSFVVFICLCLLLVVFRAENVERAVSIWKIMFSFHAADYSWITRDRLSQIEPLWLVLPALFVIIELRHVFQFDSSKLAIAVRERIDLGWLAIAVLLLASVYLRGSSAAFIYAGF
ncbi:MAG TPA: MBOAT family O-acyltransferase [Kofleriaceae bacterium]|jgi:D-alanyl-lipoteichoic acid acyltransferase DltB (MBOAT superfamily)